MTPKQRDKYLLKNYGISLEEYNTKLKQQNGVCACCNTLQPRMCVDHIHVLGYKKMPPEEKKKYVRGIVCFYCNTSFKVFERTKDGQRNRALLNGVNQYFHYYTLKGESL